MSNASFSGAKDRNKNYNEKKTDRTAKKIERIARVDIYKTLRIDPEIK